MTDINLNDANPMVKGRVLRWFDDMVKQTGVYDGMDEIGETGEVHTVSPLERIHEMFLKRLYNQDVLLGLPEIPEIGNIDLLVVDFDLDTMAENGFITDNRFTSSRGIKGRVKINWIHRHLTIIPDGGGFEDYLFYTINQFTAVSHRLITFTEHKLKLEIGLSLDVIPLDIYGVNNKEQYDAEFLKSSQNMAYSKTYIQALLRSDGGYFPERPVTFKEVANITGVTPSTLSDLKNGKKSIDNLTYSTFAALAHYGYLRFFDKQMYDAFILLNKDAFSDDVPIVGEHTKNDETHRIHVVLNDNQRYTIEAPTNEGAMMEYDAIVNKYNDNTRTITLQNCVAEDETLLGRLMIPKDKISHVYVESFNTFEDRLLSENN